MRYIFLALFFMLASPLYTDNELGRNYNFPSYFCEEEYFDELCTVEKLYIQFEHLFIHDFEQFGVNSDELMLVEWFESPYYYTGMYIYVLLISSHKYYAAYVIKYDIFNESVEYVGFCAYENAKYLFPHKFKRKYYLPMPAIEVLHRNQKVWDI